MRCHYAQFSEKNEVSILINDWVTANCSSVLVAVEQQLNLRLSLIRRHCCQPEHRLLCQVTRSAIIIETVRPVYIFYLGLWRHCWRLQSTTELDFRTATGTWKPANLKCSVPQGSVIGPQKFIAYTGHIIDTTDVFSVDHNLYADDTQLQKHMRVYEIQANCQNLAQCVVASLSGVHPDDFSWTQTRLN